MTTRAGKHISAPVISASFGRNRQNKCRYVGSLGEGKTRYLFMQISRSAASGRTCGNGAALMLMMLANVKWQCKFWFSRFRVTSLAKSIGCVYAVLSLRLRVGVERVGFMGDLIIDGHWSRHLNGLT